jgi:uncharacterized protein YndB with AHSA1/START domain
MRKKILLAFALAIIAFAAYVNSRPDQYSVTRTLEMKAAPARIFPYINDLEQWQEWSPWARLDPLAEVTYAGPRKGKGAVMSWNGNMDVGAGSMTITESHPLKEVVYRLDFTKPLAGTSTASISLEQKRNITEVTWTMEGENDLIAKLMGLVFDCEKMVGEQFEKGLGNLKDAVEYTRPLGSVIEDPRDRF